MAMRTTSWLFVVVVVCSWAPPASAQDCPELAGWWPFGPATAVAASGDYAYFGSGAALVVADVSDSVSPNVVGHVGLPNEIRAVAFSAGLALVAADSAGLRVIDVGDPSDPVEVGWADTGRATDVAVSGNFAYVIRRSIAGTPALAVIDISTPSDPVELGSLWVGTWSGVSVSGDYVYVAAGDEVLVIDVSDPSSPIEVGSSDAPFGASDVVVTGDYAFVADNSTQTATRGLRVFDVSTPSDPTEVGFLPTTTLGTLVVSDGYVYLGGGPFRVIDVSTPSQPVEVGHIDRWAEFVAESGGHAYITNPFGLEIIDVSNPSSPAVAGVWIAPGEATDVAVAGGYAYVVEDYVGLRVIDVSTPSSPIEVGLYESPEISGVVVSGDYLYVIDAASLRVIDVSIPTAPVEVGSCDVPFAGTITVSGGYAYVGAGGSLRVIDVSVPSAPVEVGFFDTLGFVGQVAVSDEFAYVICRSVMGSGVDGLLLLDLSDPTSPAEVWFDGTEVWGVAVSGQYAYVTDRYFFRVWDVSVPSAPIEVGLLEGGGAFVKVSSGHAYYVTGSSLHVIDVSTPSLPIEVGFSYTPGGCSGGVTVVGGYVFLPKCEFGLMVFRECRESVFVDDFESGDTSAWTAVGP